MLKRVQKIQRRISWIIKSLHWMTLAVLFETKKHPWRYILGYLFYPAEKRYSYTHIYIQRYFEITKVSTDVLVKRGDFELLIPDNNFKNQKFMLSFLTVFFDIIYPSQVKYPVPCIIVEGKYEVGGAVLQPGDYVIDAGANIGVFACYASKKVGLNGQIFAFEPIPELLNIVANQKSHLIFDNLIPVKEALGNKKEVKLFNFAADNMTSATINSLGVPVEVTINTIDNYVGQNQVQKVDYIKMDIEGYERYALAGAAETIKKYKPKLSICIYHLPDDPVEIKKIISDLRSDYNYKMTKWKLYAW